MNHHGRVRKLDEDGNEIPDDADVCYHISLITITCSYVQETDPNEVVPIKVVDSDNGEFVLNLISRQEDTQVRIKTEDKKCS